MAKNPCRYFLPNGKSLSYDEVRAFMLENYELLNPTENATKEKQQFESVQSEREGGSQGGSPNQAGGSNSGGGKASSAREEGVKPKKTRKKSLLNRAYENIDDEQRKQAIEKYGLRYEISNQQEAKQAAIGFIQEVGIEQALDAVRRSEIKGDMAAYVWAQAIDAVEAQIMTTTDPEDLQYLADLHAKYFEEFNQQAKLGGQFNAALAEIYRNSDFNWKVDAMKERWLAETGEYPNQKTLELIKEVSDELARLKKEYAAAEERARKAEEVAAMANIVDFVNKGASKPKPSVSNKKRAEKAVEAIQKVRAKIKANSYSDATGIIAAVDIALDLIEKSIKTGIEVADAIEIGIAEVNKLMKGKNWDRDKFRKVATEAFESEGVEVAAIDDITDAGDIKIPNSFIRDLVRNGVTDIEDVTKAVLKELGLEDNEANHRIVRDAITGYGKTIKQNPDEIQKEIAKMKAVGRLTSAIEDVRNGIRSKRSGVQRRPLEQKEREMMKQLRELTKKLPQSDADLQRYHKTALDALKTRLKNRIEDLKVEIEKREKVKKVAKEVEYDAEAMELKAERDELQKVSDEIFKNVTLSPEEQIDLAVDKLRNSERRFERRIEEKDFASPEKKPLPDDPRVVEAKAKRDAAKQAFEEARDKVNPPEMRAAEAALKSAERQLADIEKRIKENQLEKEKKARAVYETEALKAAKAKLAEQKAFLAELQEKAGIPQKKRLEQLRKNAEKQTLTYKRRLEEGNFEKGNYSFKDGILGAFKKRVPQPTPVDAELRELDAERIRWKNKYETELHKEQLKNRGWLDKSWDFFSEGFGIPRALMSTFEFSFVLIQGGKYAIAHPKTALNAFQIAMRNLNSLSKSEEAQAKMEANPLYPLMQKSKLALSQYDARLTAREETFLGGWVNQIWDYSAYIFGIPFSPKFHERWKLFNPLKAFERAAVGYLNTIRAARFKDGVDLLELQGKTFENNPDEYKAVADVVNTFTGRSGLGKAEQIAPVLGVFLYSPRNWVSQIKLTTPYAFYWLHKIGGKGDRSLNPLKYKPSVAQKMAISDFSKSIGATLGIVAMAAAYYNSDDDDETGVSFDPRSSDFLKIKLGSTRIDPWGGLLPNIVFQTRFLLGETVNEAGEVKRLGENDYVPTRGELTWRMVKNKLSPSAGMIAKALMLKQKKDPETGEWEYFDEFGNPYSITSEVDNLYPMYWSTLADLYEEQPRSVAGLLTLYALLGGGVSTYEGSGKTNYPKETDEQVAKLLDKTNTDVMSSRKPKIDNAYISEAEYVKYKEYRTAAILDELKLKLDHLNSLEEEQFNIEMTFIKKNAASKAKTKIQQERNQ